jgi:hypothetical protein
MPRRARDHFGEQARGVSSDDARDPDGHGCRCRERISSELAVCNGPSFTSRQILPIRGQTGRRASLGQIERGERSPQRGHRARGNAWTSGARALVRGEHGSPAGGATADEWSLQALGRGSVHPHARREYESSARNRSQPVWRLVPCSNTMSGPSSSVSWTTVASVTMKSGSSALAPG